MASRSLPPKHSLTPFKTNYEKRQILLRNDVITMRLVQRWKSARRIIVGAQRWGFMQKLSGSPTQLFKLRILSSNVAGYACPPTLIRRSCLPLLKVKRVTRWNCFYLPPFLPAPSLMHGFSPLDPFVFTVKHTSLCFNIIFQPSLKPLPPLLSLTIRLL